MSYTSCAAQVAANIAKDCDTPMAAGYTGRGVMIAIADAPTIVVSSTNPRILTSITMATGKKTIVIDNVWADPFNGTTKQSNADAGRTQYGKTFAFRIPLRGADVSKDIVEPLSNAPLGYMVILEKKDRRGLGSYEVVGYCQGLQANADGIVQNEAENGGDIMVTMSCQEEYFEVDLYDTSYADTKEAFEDLIAASY